MALDICATYEKKVVLTGRDTGATGEEYAKYLMDTFQASNLEEKWNSYQK